MALLTRRTRITLGVLLFGLVLVSAVPSEAAIVSLTVDSEAGDPILQGEDVDVLYATGTGATIVQNVITTLNDAPTRFTLTFRQGTTDNGSFLLDSQELGEPLTVGVYNNAVRTPILNDGLQPGLDFTFRSRGNNRHAGSFEILELETTGTLASVELTRLRANFSILADGASGGLTGSIFFDAAAVPEPSSALFACFGAAALCLRRKR